LSWCRAPEPKYDPDPSRHHGLSPASPGQWSTQRRLGTLRDPASHRQRRGRKKQITACRVTPDLTGQQADGLLELQDFGTMTADLLMLSDWLAAAGVTHVAMESTGEYWKPVFNILEGALRSSWSTPAMSSKY
jgi:hypothetical protein